MSKFVLGLVAVFTLILAPAAFAAPGAGWHKVSSCSDSDVSNATVEKSQDKNTLYFCPTGVTASVLLRATAPWYFTFDPDYAGTAGSARVYLRQCQFATANANNCERVLVDNDGDGAINTGALDGTTSPGQNRTIYGLPPGFYYVEVTVALTGGETPVGKAQIH